MWQLLSVLMLWMCELRKPYIKTVNWYDFKMHDFSAIDMLIKTSGGRVLLKKHTQVKVPLPSKKVVWVE